MKNSLLLLFTVLLVSQLGAQNPVAQQYGKLITTKDLKENLEIIASDAMEGRETGKRGQKMAAAFISASFEELGLTAPVDGNFYQNLDLYTTAPGEIYVRAKDGTQLKNFEDITYYGTSSTHAENAQLVFAGKGTLDELNAAGVKGKAVLILKTNDEPTTAGDLARENGATMVFYVSPDPEGFAQSAAQVRNAFARNRLSLTKPEFATTPGGAFIISHKAVEKIFNVTVEKLVQSTSTGPAQKNLKKIKPAVISYKTTLEAKTVKTENVLGFLEGTDKKEELLVITAHYDHIGKKRSGEGDLINNGADDDGSGTVAVLQLAKVFAQAKREGHGPRRSILFMTVTGEEKGLLGSEYYTTHPVYPLENTVVNLNIDMIGRTDPQHKDSAAYVYVIGADKLSSELNKLSEQVNEQYTKLAFDYVYNDESHPDRLYYRSDHWNFAKKNIPIIFYFDGIHEDYHKPDDEVEKIEFDLLALRTQCIFYTAWEIVNREQRIVPDQKKN